METGEKSVPSLRGYQNLVFTKRHQKLVPIYTGWENEQEWSMVNCKSSKIFIIKKIRLYHWVVGSQIFGDFGSPKSESDSARQCRIFYFLGSWEWIKFKMRDNKNLYLLPQKNKKRMKSNTRDNEFFLPFTQKEKKINK